MPIQGFLDLFFDAAPTIENKTEQTIQNTKVASAKVAFDTLRYFLTSSQVQLHNKSLEINNGHGKSASITITERIA